MSNFYSLFLPAFLAFAQRALAASEICFFAAALSLRRPLAGRLLPDVARRLPFLRGVPSSAKIAALRLSRCSVSRLSISARSIGLEL